MDYTLVESYTLPSLGKIYNVPVEAEVELRSMTTDEEMRRMRQSDRPLKVLADIIDACLVRPLGISAYDMCLGDYQYLLHKLRVVTYGPEYKLTVVCPYCNSSSENIINLDEFAVNHPVEDIKDLLTFTLPKSGHKITVTFQTPRLLDDVQVRLKELKKQGAAKDTDLTLMLLLSGVIQKVDDNVVDIVKKESFVRKLPMMDTNYILKHVQQLDERVGMDTTLHCTCDFCGFEFTSPFRETGEFFGPSIEL